MTFAKKREDVKADITTYKSLLKQYFSLISKSCMLLSFDVLKVKMVTGLKKNLILVINHCAPICAVKILSNASEPCQQLGGMVSSLSNSQLSIC